MSKRTNKEPTLFTLTVNLGNDAMRTPQDVRGILNHVASLLDSPADWNEYDALRHPIRDCNGNRVGEWIVR